MIVFYNSRNKTKKKLKIVFYKIYVILNVKLITSELYVFTREFMKDN
jgi:hypothetical protein